MSNPRATAGILSLATYIPKAFHDAEFIATQSETPAGSLSVGQQRMVAIGRALMADPKVLILDEPSAGLQPSIVMEVFHRLKDIKKSVSVLVTEQNVRQALKAIDRGYILENGRIAMADTAQNLAGNDHIRKSYLGI